MKRILLVDDHPDIRRLMRLSLGSVYELSEADNAPAALVMARQAPPDLMVVDVMMPGEIDGLGLLDAVRADAALAGIPVVMVTARGQKHDEEDAMARGASAYVIKPFSPLALKDRIVQLIGT